MQENKPNKKSEKVIFLTNDFRLKEGIIIGKEKNRLYILSEQNILSIHKDNLCLQDSANLLTQ